MRRSAIVAGLVVLGVGCSGESRSPSTAAADGGSTSATPPSGATPAFQSDAAPSGSAGCLGGEPPNKAQDITIDPTYASKYTAFDLGEVPGLPQGKYGGVVLMAGDENTLLLGGGANFAGAGIYAIRVVRSHCKHIIGFAGKAQRIASADYIDGGLVYGPGNTLMYAAWPMDPDVRQNTSGMLGLIPPGASAPSKTILGTSLGVPEALAALNFVPPGFPGEGKLKLVTWEGGAWYDATIAIGANGQVEDVPSATHRMTVPGGPEGFAYVPPGSPLFGPPSMVVSEWSQNSVATYEVGGDGDPTLGTRKTFLTGLSGAEGAFFDPPTGDFVFSTWNTMRPERIVVVLGFAPVTPPK